MAKSRYLFILNFVSKMLDIRTSYNDIKNNADAKKVSTLLGKRGLRYIISFLLTAGIGGIVVSYFLKYIDTLAIIFAILGIILGVSLIIISIFYVLLGLSCTIKQLKLNKKAIGWIDLVLIMLSLIAVIVAIVIVLNK